ncbi:hypothetical protein Tco_0556968 [Tanacetum coccineum]
MCAYVATEIQGLRRKVDLYVLMMKGMLRQQQQQQQIATNAKIQRRLWDPGIKIFFRHHLEDNVVVKEWRMIRQWLGYYHSLLCLGYVFVLGKSLFRNVFAFNAFDYLFRKQQKQAAAFQAQFEALTAELQSSLGQLQGRPGGNGDQASLLPRSMRWDVPKFTGEDPDSCIFAITEYFSLLNTPADQRLMIVSFNLEGAAVEWFQSEGVLSKLLQLGTVEDYQREFEELMNHVTDIPDSLLISFYIFGLKLHLQREFLGSRPTTLGDMFLFAQTIEARLDDQAAPVAGTTTKTFGNHGGDESESSGPVTPTEEDDQSFAENESYLSGDQYFLSKQILMDEDELNLLRPDFVLKEFISQTDEFIIAEGQILGKTSMVHMDDLCIDEEQHGSVRSIGIAINSDVANFVSKVPGSGSLGVYEL